MKTSPLANQFTPRLEKLNREINAGLSEVRRHLKELEEAERSQQNGSSTRFAEVLKASIDTKDQSDS